IEAHLLESFARRGDRARGFAAAARPLSQQLVPRRVVPPAQRHPQLRARRGARRVDGGGKAEGRRRERARRGARERLRHLLRQESAVGDAAVHARTRALRDARGMAPEATRATRARRSLCPRSAVLLRARADDGHPQVRAGHRGARPAVAARRRAGQDRGRGAALRAHPGGELSWTAILALTISFAAFAAWANHRFLRAPPTVA